MESSHGERPDDHDTTTSDARHAARRHHAFSGPHFRRFAARPLSGQSQVSGTDSLRDLRRHFRTRPLECGRDARRGASGDVPRLRPHSRQTAGRSRDAVREFFNAHRTELLQLARNAVESERAEHPLHRIMEVADTAAGAEISTCDIHSARRIGEALKSAYDGELDMRFGEDEYSVRVHWTR